MKEAWGRAFGIASVLTPFLLGTCAAAVAGGQIRVRNGAIPVALFHPWLTPFALVIGAMALALCATIAPIYLTVEAQRAKNAKLVNAFRTRSNLIGVYQSRGIDDVSGHGVEIRYKLVQAAGK